MNSVWKYIVLYTGAVALWLLMDWFLPPVLRGGVAGALYLTFSWILLGAIGGALIYAGARRNLRRGHESELRMQALADLAADGIISIDERGIIQSFNRAAERLFDYSAEQVIGRNVSLLMPRPYRDEHDGYLAAYRRTGRASIIGRGREVTGKRRDGAEFPLYLSVSEVRLDRTRRFFMGMVHDLSELKAREHSLARQKEALEDKTRDLEKLADELKRSNMELEQFAYVASHDLQEPLRMVASYVQLLARRYQDRLDENANDFINYAVDGARRMQSLINDLLTYSRVGRNAKPAGPVDLGRALEFAKTNLQLLIEDAEAEIELENELPCVRGDATQMLQLFQNLLGNAVKFRHPERRPRIRIRSERGPAARLAGAVARGRLAVQPLDGSNGASTESAAERDRRDEEARHDAGAREFVRIEIEDNGIGIEAEYQEKIFVIFQRLNPRSEYPGTGIGLAVCKKIVELHGGRMEVRSDGASGSVFAMSLPLWEGPVPSPHASRLEAQEGGNGKHSSEEARNAHASHRDFTR